MAQELISAALAQSAHACDHARRETHRQFLPVSARLIDGKTIAATLLAQVRERVQAARERQQQRSGVANFRLGTKQIEQVCALDDANRRLLELAMQRLSLSARAASCRTRSPA